VKSGKEGPVNGWVERFDSPVENFWVLGEVRYMEDVKSCFSQCSCSTACWYEFKSEVWQASGEVNYTGFIPYAEKSAGGCLNGAHTVNPLS